MSFAAFVISAFMVKKENELWWNYYMRNTISS